MTRLSVRLAFFAAGLWPLMTVVNESGILPTVPYIHLLIWLPALFVGSVYLIQTYLYKSQLAVNLVLLLMLLGLLWVSPTEVGRGALVTASILVSLAIAVVVSNQSLWRESGHAFILGTIISVGVAFTMWGSNGFIDFGSLRSLNGSIVVNRNAFAWQLGAAIVICCLLLSGTLSRKSKKHVLVGCLIVLALALVLTGSRGGFLGTIVSVSVIALLNRSVRIVGWRLFWLYIGGSSLLLGFLLIPNPVRDRFAVDSVGSLGGRTDIWIGMNDALLASPLALVFGYGTGGADKALARFLGQNPTIVVGPDSVPRVSPHNAYVDWFVSYGVIGALVGMVFLIWLVGRLIKLYRKGDGGASISFAFYFAVTSISGVVYVQPVAIGVIALFLGYLMFDKRDPELSKRRLV